MAKNKGTPIVILGMHRSGTSLLANMLHSIGISMGKTFLEADKFNIKGYFEDTDFLGINKDILETAGGTWYDPPSVKEIVEGDDKFEKIITEMIARKRKLAGNSSWGWKDPRTCITCWKFASEIPDAKFVVIVRKISDIKLSLNKSHGHLANWDKVVDVYYNSVDKFLNSYPNDAINIGFEELVYQKYAKDVVPKIVDFVEKPRRTVQRALNTIQFR